ncbi:hypothetical protein DVH05_004572 [Phytophthora capsici]|nr:hypothetical protein DVH05_004572 [Phytophthora capsici]
MTTEVDILQRWGFLEPWLCLLRPQYSDGVYLRQNSSFEPVQFYVFITLPAAQDEAQMTLEGLKLVAAVAHVDYNAWKKLRLSHYDVAFGERGEQYTDNGSIIRFQLLIGKNGTSVNDIVQMCGIHQHDHPRREYSEALARIAAMDAKHNTKRHGVEIPVPVVALVMGSVLPNELVDLRDAQKTLKRQWEDSSLPPVQPGGLRCSFVLSAVNAYLKDFPPCSIRLDMATKMQQLISENVWFSQIIVKLDFNSKVTRVKKEVFGRLLASFFGSTHRLNESPTQLREAGNGTSSIRQQLDHLSIYLDKPSRHDMEAVYSAAIGNQTVRELELIYNRNPIDSVHWWQWIAYAFFSKRARTYSSLEGLAIRKIEKMTTAEVEAFCGILTSENPEEELFGCSSANTGLQEATLTANSPIRWDFDGKPVVQSDIVQFPSPIPFVWIMSTSEETEWVDALVPGYGRCQVPRRNLVFNDPVSATTRGNDLTSLEINVGYYRDPGRDLSGLPQFIGAVGSTLKMLTVDAVDSDFDMKIVLENCPNLEKLCFKKHWNSAIFNFSEYQAAGFPVPVFPFRFGNIVALTEELMNPDSDLTKCMQRLTLYPDHDHRYYLNSSGIEDKLGGLLDMLETNGRLEYLEVQLRYPNCYSNSIVEGFKKFHLQPIDRSAKLDTQRKIAFLSVLSSTSTPIPQKTKRQRETGDKRSNWEKVDANVVTNIFHFAVAPLLRKVYVTYAS